MSLNVSKSIKGCLLKVFTVNLGNTCPKSTGSKHFAEGSKSVRFLLWAWFLGSLAMLPAILCLLLLVFTASTGVKLPSLQDDTTCTLPEDEFPGIQNNLQGSQGRFSLEFFIVRLKSMQKSQTIKSFLQATTIESTKSQDLADKLLNGSTLGKVHVGMQIPCLAKVVQARREPWRVGSMDAADSWTGEPGVPRHWCVWCIETRGADLVRCRLWSHSFRREDKPYARYMHPKRC